MSVKNPRKQNKKPTNRNGIESIHATNVPLESEKIEP